MKPGFAMALVAFAMSTQVSAATVTWNMPSQTSHVDTLSSVTDITFMSSGNRYVASQNGALWQQTPGRQTESSIPVPAAAWLFLSGLVGMIGVSRRKRKG